MRDKIADAPEKIWAGPSEDDKGVFWDVGHWDADFDADCTQYTRTDLGEARITELETALKSVLKAVDDDIIMVRPSERTEFMELLGQLGDALSGEET